MLMLELNSFKKSYDFQYGSRLATILSMASGSDVVMRPGVKGEKELRDVISDR